MLDNHDSVSHNNNNSQQQHAANIHREGIMRKLPQDAEGAMVMVAMEDSLNGPGAALIRLVDPPVFDNFLEAPIPLRFIFFLVGPDYSNVDYHEVGRAMSTLFSDDVSSCICGIIKQNESEFTNIDLGIEPNRRNSSFVFYCFDNFSIGHNFGTTCQILIGFCAKSSSLNGK